MRRSFLTVALVLLAAGVARADVGPNFSSPDFKNTPTPVTAAVGLGLAAILIFGGAWAVRHPRAFLGAMLAGPGLLLAGVGGVILIQEGAIGGLICLVPGLAMFAGGGWLMWQREPFVGRSLLYLMLALIGVAGTVVALDHVTWVRRLRPSEEFRLRQKNLESPPTTAAKPTE